MVTECFWAVVRTVAGRESFAAERVADRGFEVFLPRTRVKISRLQSKIVPVFPGYFFVRLVDRWHSIEKTFGVLGLIMAGDHPARCQPHEIDRIRAAQARNGLIKLPQPPRRRIQPGVTVRILSGPFRGLNALYEGQSARERELVLLELLGRQVPIELGEDVQIASI